MLVLALGVLQSAEKPKILQSDWTAKFLEFAYTPFFRERPF